MRSNLHPIIEQTLAPFVGVKSRMLKSWKQQHGDLSVKVEMHQDGPTSFEVACYRLGATIPVLYKFSTFESASAYYSSFIDFNTDQGDFEKQLLAELESLHSLCVSAQCWLDAAGNLAPDHLKAAFQGNADEFRKVYGKITS